jgi:hypothetical protein
MLDNSTSNSIAMVLSIAFGISALVHLAGPRVLTQLYARLEYPRTLHLVTGAIQLLTALFLALPQTHIWGVFLAYFVTFISVVTLLNHRQYVWSVAGVLLMVALVPVALAVPG